ncbi:MAG: secretion protein, partial [Megasphaera sp.]|nr:secretion protein [Megasphaera sp.]
MNFYTKAWTAAVCCFLPFQAVAIDVQVRDVPVRTVLEGLARSGHINLIVDDSVDGTLTMTLHDITVDEALQAIADSKGLYYDASGPIRTMTGPHS